MKRPGRHPFVPKDAGQAGDAERPLRFEVASRRAVLNAGASCALAHAVQFVEMRCLPSTAPDWLDNMYRTVTVAPPEDGAGNIRAVCE